MSDKGQILYANDNATLKEINETWERLKKANQEFYSKASMMKAGKSEKTSIQ